MASDVTQQVFLKLMTSIGQFRGDAEFSTWLYRLVVNACMDAARRRKSDALTSDRSRLEAFAGPDSQEEDYARSQGFQRRIVQTMSARILSRSQIRSVSVALFEKPKSTARVKNCWA